MSSTIELWYPNYRNNPGIVSKELRKSVNQATKHFEVDVGEGYFDGYERYILDIEFHNPSYQDYIIQQLHLQFGKFIDVNELSEGDHILGRLVSPGKVGFGIFVDIGIRNDNKHNDALLPLYQIREDIELDEISTREIVKMLGFIDGYPIPVIIESIETNPKTRINVALDEEFISTMDEWSQSNRERMIFTKTLKSNISNLVKDLNLSKYIDEITAIDPLTTVVTCDPKTNASGLLPKLGARLRNVPIGIFHP